ncbi:MAG TPA: dipeptide/oligopeptide/nickel ABC transporter permease/ATP-binding protein [Candidatus Dormibacteraeota bacterium]|jgi:oligopeptide/dipeptide ABC transporter ATP-binding protein|nr:dipeptide/oligopeptide/nickel ABC transporter permease/ATP-binding protein [Candidatus Dormibacteraeota bacterium]
MTISSASLTEVAPAGGPGGVAFHRTRILQLPRSPKVIAGLVMLGFFALVAVLGKWAAPYSPNATDPKNWVQHILVDGTGPGTSFPAQYYPLPFPPSAAHWLGTTVFAQDALSQVLASTQATLFVGLLAAAIATILSILFGVTAGYVGGGTDEGLSLVANVFLAIPGLPLLIVLADYVPNAGSSIFLVAAIIAVTTWAYSARTLRAQTLSLRNRDFVEAARVSGEGRLRIILVEVLPNLIPIVAASFLFTTLSAIGAYIAIAFLGLAGSPTADPPGLWNWGEMLREGFANNAVRSGWWWWWAPPGIMVALLGTSLALLNFGIDEFINPRLRAGGLSRKAAKKAGISPSTRLGLTPVAKSVLEAPQPAARQAVKGIAAEPVLEVRGLCIDYGVGEGAVHAVMDCDLVLRRGQVLGLAGESGSGKTTLALAAIRLLRPPAVITAGSVLFHSKPISGGAAPGTIDLLAADLDELRELRWSEIAVVLQSALDSLNPVITIGAQFDDLLRVHRPHMSGAERWSRSGELLEMVGMNADRLRSYPHELSGGMRQRAMIAMAIALEPQVIILDEPTTALDVVTQREILEELIGLRDRIGFATLFITHDLSLLVELADDIAVMYAGRLMERAPAGSLFHAPRLPYTHGLLNCFPPLHGAHHRMEGIAGSPPDLRDLPTGCAFNPRCRWAMQQCREERPRLLPLDGSSREVACWLHRGDAVVPPELARPEPAARKVERAAVTQVGLL